MDGRLKFLIVLVVLFGVYKWQFALSQLKTDGPYRLKYIEKTYGNVQKGEAVPMVIVLHGSGSNEKDLLDVFERMDFKGRVISLRGPIRHIIGFEWWEQFAKDEKEYYQMARRKSEQAAQSIIGSISSLTKKYPTQGRPFLYGFSRGGQVTFYTALHYPQYFEAVLVGSGDQHPALFPKELHNPIPIYAFHGLDDGVIGHAGAKVAVQMTNDMHGNARLKLYSAEHEINSEMIKDMRFVLTCFAYKDTTCGLINGFE